MAMRRALQLAATRQISPNTATTTHSIRCYASAAASGDNNDNYVSPFADFFQQLQSNKASFGATVDSPEQNLTKCGIPEDKLKFRTMHYGRLQLAPHVQPWEHRVTLKVQCEDLPISSQAEFAILQEIVGARLNLERRELRLSSNQFGSRIENKRHLVSMLDRIVLGAQRLAKEQEQQQATETTKA